MKPLRPALVLVAAAALVLASDWRPAPAPEAADVIVGPYASLLAASTDLGPAHTMPVQLTVALRDHRRPDALIRWTGPFSFYRGSAAVMAADLAAGPSSGINVVCCGDAHIANFGIYAAPHRALVFDLNDFDEAAFAPWEWDVKRLIASAVIGGRHNGYRPKTVRAIVDRAAMAYQDALRDILELDVLDRYYLRPEPALYRNQVSKSMQSVLDRSVRRARERTSARAFARIMTAGAGGSLRLREDPPVLQHVTADVETQLVESFREYLTSVRADVALLLSHFRVTDIALRVVGAASVAGATWPSSPGQTERP